MNKKKALLTVLAMVLVCVMSVMGTVAYLQASTADAPVRNTFVYAGGEKDFVKNLELKEYQVNQDEETGKYTQTTTEVDKNSYKVLPGTTIPKQAFVRVTEKNAAPAYLYIEVVGTLNDVYSWSVDAASWTKMDGVTGKNGGTVYVYKETIGETASLTVDILLNDQITVSKDATEEQLGTTASTLTFYAYLAQASINNVDDAATIYNTVFNTPANP